jgi:two-component system response regulator AtoC
MARVLVVDDEANLRKILSAQLKREGYDVVTASDGEQAMAELTAHGADVLITDMVMPRMGGLELLKWTLAELPQVPVIIITAHGTVDSAVEAIKLGAFHYISKPFDQDELKQVVAMAARQRDLSRQNLSGDGPSQRAIVGASVAMQEVFKIIDKVADTPSTVLITGESGTGKELVATALHESSSRKGRPLIKINCGAIPDNLVESELFGYERGAFTGAVTSKPGRFELADTGTLFLDEIGEVPVEMQVKLLRALQYGEFERVGGLKTLKVDVRLIAATNRDLATEIAAGRFREDLFYRLAVVPIRLPALRDRKADLPMLAAHFVEKYNKRLNKRIQGFDDSALAALQGYGFPGNIRELENLVERTLLFADGPFIKASDLPSGVTGLAPGPTEQAVFTDPRPPSGSSSTPDASRPSSGGAPLVVEPLGLKDRVKQKMAEMERDEIIKALDETGGNVSQAAKLLQISRKTLQTKMKEFGLRDADRDDPE